MPTFAERLAEAGQPEDQPLLPDAEQTQLGARYDFARQLRGDTASQLRMSTEIAKNKQPERAAEALTLAQRTGMPVNLVESNLDAIRAEVQKQDFDPDRFARESPIVARWVAEHPNHAAVARDDMTQLGAIEWLIRAPREAAARGMENVELNRLSLKEMRGTLAPEERGRLEMLELEERKRRPIAESLWQRMIAGTFEQLPQTAGSIAGGVERGVQGALIAGSGAIIAGQLGPQVLVPEEAITVPVAMSAGFTAGMMVGSGEWGYEQEAGAAYREYKRFKDAQGRPMDPGAARVAATAAGVLNAGLEAAQVGFLVRSIPGLGRVMGAPARDAVAYALRTPTTRMALTNLAREFGVNLAGEVATEVGQRAVTIMAGELAKYAEGGFTPRGAGEIGSELLQEAQGALESFPLMLLPGHTMGLARDLQASRVAQNRASYFQALGEGVASSKTFERLPAAMQQLVERATKDGPIENVRIDAGDWVRYWQSQKLDPLAVAKQVLGSDRPLVQALAVEGDLVIPTARYATTIAPSAHNAELSLDLKLKAGEMTARQAQALEEELKGLTSRVDQEMQSEQQQEGAVEAKLGQLKEQLTATGKFTPDVVDLYAKTLYSKPFRVLAARAGLDPVQLLERYMPRVFAAQEAPTGSMADALEQKPPLAQERQAIYALEEEVNERWVNQHPDARVSNDRLFTTISDKGEVNVVWLPHNPQQRDEALAKVFEFADQRGMAVNILSSVGESIPLLRAHADLEPLFAGEGVNKEPERQFNTVMAVRKPKGKTLFQKQALVDIQRDEAGGVNPAETEAIREEARGRLGRTLVRDPSVGAPTNKRTVFKDEQGELVVGKITHADWIKRVSSVLTVEELHAARTWYRQLFSLFEPTYGEQAARVGLAWLMSQQNTTPSGGMLNVLRAMDLERGLPPIGYNKAGLAEDKIRAALRGETPEEGLGAKLLDFIDSELGLTTRTVMGRDPRGGAPAVIDVWAARDVGRIDPQTHDYLARRFGEKAAKRVAVDLPHGLSEAGYEYGSRFYNDLARELSAQGFDGGNWIPSEVQAVGWVAMQKAFGREAEFVSDLTRKNTRRVSLGLLPGEGAPQFQGDPQERVQALAKLTGVNLVQFTPGAGAYLGSVEPAFQLDAFASPEAVEDFMLALGYAFGQTEVWGTRHFKSGKQHAIHIVGPGLSTMQRASDLFERMHEHLAAAGKDPVALIPGFQQVQEGGTPGIRLINPMGHWRKGDLQAINAAAHDAGVDLGIELTDAYEFPVELRTVANDWTKQKAGEGYTDALRDRGRTQIAEQLEREFSPARVATEGRADGATPGSAGVSTPDGGQVLFQTERSLAAEFVEGEVYHGTRNAFYAFKDWLADKERLLSDKWQAIEFINRKISTLIGPHFGDLSQASHFVSTDGGSTLAGGRIIPVRLRAGFELVPKPQTMFDDDAVGLHVMYEALSQRKNLHLLRQMVDARDTKGMRAPSAEQWNLAGVRVWGTPEQIERWERWSASGDPVQLPAIRRDLSMFIAEKLQRGEWMSKEQETLLRNYWADTIEQLQGERDEDLNVPLAVFLLTRGDFANASSLPPSLKFDILSAFRDQKREEGIHTLQYFNSVEGDPYSPDNFSYIALSPPRSRWARYNPDEQYNWDVLSQDTTRSPEDKSAQALAFVQFTSDRKFNIGLLEKANLSSFIHETGHIYLELLGDLAEQSADETLKRDYQTILKWLGVESRDQIKVEHHEQFARGIEAYFLRGTAPSSALREAFTRIRTWMKRVYAEMLMLNVNLTPEVRDVFDRMFATDTEIDLAKQADRLLPLFVDAQTAGMSENMFAAYQDKLRKVTVEGRERLQARMMRDIKRAQTAEYAARKEEITTEISKQVHEEPVYKAAYALRRNMLPDGTPRDLEHVKLSSAGIKEIGETTKGLAFMVAKTGGLHPDVAAEQFGFRNGAALINDLRNAEPMQIKINRLVKTQLDAEFGDMLTNDEARRDMAIRSLHTDARADVIEMELKALDKLVRQAKPVLQAAAQDQRAAQRSGLEMIESVDEGPGEAATRRIRGERRTVIIPSRVELRRMAEGMIGMMSVRSLDPNSYLHTARKASELAMRAAVKQDFALAAAQKRIELMNMALYDAAFDARERADEIAEYMRQFERTSVRQRLGKAGHDYLDQIDALLARFEFARVPYKRLDKRAALQEWIKQKQDSGETMGEEFNIPQYLADESVRTNYRELRVDDLAGIYDTVRQIEHIARLKNKLLAQQKAQDWDDARSALAGAALQNLKLRPPAPLTRESLSAFDKLSSAAREVDASLLKMEQLVEWLDGGTTGPWHDYWWNPAAEAQGREYDLTREITAKVAKAVENIPTDVRKVMLDKVTLNLTKTTIVRKDLLAIALNVGNEGNYQKMLRGMNWSEEQVQEMLDKLTKEEWGFVQSVWDTLESLWPAIAKLQKELTGLEPEKVEARTVKTAFGEMRGGYYPIMYDPTLSDRGGLQLSSTVGGLIDNNYVRATTPQGHTKARIAGFSAPFDFNLGRLPSQIAGTIKDLTHRKWLMDANRILRDTEIRAAISNTLGPEYVKLLEGWVRNVANDRNVGNLRALDVWQRSIEHVRFNTTIAALGLKVSTIVTQFAGLGPSIEVVGARYMTSGFARFLRNPVGAYAFVTEQSAEMRHRLETRDDTIRDQLRQLGGRTDVVADIKRFSLYGIGVADMMVSLPTWLGAYEKAIQAGAERAQAIREGDRAVRLSQGAGGAKDLAMVAVRSNTLMRLLTMFYTPFSALYARLRDIGHEVGGIRDLPRAATRVWWVWLMPAVLAEVLTGRAPDEEDDEGEWAKFLAGVALYPTASIPLLRDAVSYVTKGYSYQFSPLAQVFQATGDVAKEIGKFAVDEGDIEKLAARTFKASGYWLGLPTGQLSITGGYILDLARGDQEPESLRDFFSRLLFRQKDK